MKSVVLDTNELQRDWLCCGLKYQLLEHMHAGWLNVYVPAVVFDELMANHAREVGKVERQTAALVTDRRRLGIAPIVSEGYSFDYRHYLLERFDQRLGFTVLPWPNIAQEDLVSRAVARTQPFNEKGGGYRDSLVWSDVVELARRGNYVAFVSADKVFAGDDGQLAPALRAEVDQLRGTVELVRDFASWLISELPWSASDLASAVNTAQESAFLDYYMQSDFQDDLVPAVEDLGFQWAPYEYELIEVVWNGDFVQVGGAVGPDGLTINEYDIGQDVVFTAQFPESLMPEPGWRVSEPDLLRRVDVEGTVEMVVRVAVLFGDEFGFSVDELSWRRTDGTRPGAHIANVPDPNQLTLVDLQDEINSEHC